MNAGFAAAFMVMVLFAPQVSAADIPTYNERVVYSFCAAKGCKDGAMPSGVIAANGLLYGTTQIGGGYRCGGSGCGTVFSVDPGAGTETVLYSFAGYRKGANPQAGLIDVKGKLFGTTEYGGAGYYDQGWGTVFAIDPNPPREKVIYDFCPGQQRCPDGAYPFGALISMKNNLYGTTSEAGDAGNIFSVNPKTGVEKIVYAFCSQKDCTDGLEPASGVIAVNGLLYGTTFIGGGIGCDCCDDGCGTVFSVDPGTGTESVLHAFGNTGDGAMPEAGLLNANGMLYGTTTIGGNNGCSGYFPTCGTVFSVDPATGSERVLYAFCGQKNCADGANPYAGLIEVNGLLYGTTETGGGNGCGGTGCGTVFSVDPNTGAETVIHSFAGGKDGANPEAGLTDVNGKLFGTTSAGGGEFCGGTGCGTVFALETQR